MGVVWANNSFKLLMLIAISIISINSVSAEQIAFDGFESTSFCGGVGWSDSCWTTSGLASIQFFSPYEGTRFAYMQGTGTTIQRTVDVSGYDSVNVSFARRIQFLLQGTDIARFSVISDGQETVLQEWTSVDNTWQLYNFEITNMPSDGLLTLKFTLPTAVQNTFHVDAVGVDGELTPNQEVNVIASNNYGVNDIAIFDLSSTESSVLHTLEVSYPNGTIICENNFLSPSVPNTVFTYACQMPSEPVVDAKAYFYLTNDNSINSTDYFNVIGYTQDSNLLDIKNVYFSNQVLQGSSTEIFALIESAENITYKNVVLTFPDNETRIITLSKTENENEYRAYITDTYDSGNVSFTINVRTDNYIDSYSNQYYVAPYSVDFVDTVNYVNKILEATIEVHGTEYVPGDRAKVWVQVIDEFGDAVNDALCEISIYTPNGGVFISDTTMTSQGIDGIYYYDFIAPNTNGVYPAIAQCFFSTQQTFESADSFSITTGSAIGGTYTDTWTLNGVAHDLREGNIGSTKRLNATYNFNNMCGRNISESLLTGVSFVINTDWDSVVNDNLILSFYNWSSGSWQELPNRVISPNTGQTVTNTLDINNVTSSGVVNSTTNQTRFRITDTNIADSGTSTAEIDYLAVTCNQFADPSYQTVKGSAEAHISSRVQGDLGFYVYTLDSGYLANETYLDYFDIFYTVASQTASIEEDVTIELPLFYAFSGDHITNVSVLNTTTGNYTDINFSYRIDEDSMKDFIYFELDLQQEQNYQIRARATNEWKLEIFSDYDSINLLNDFISIACGDYVSSNGLQNFTIPRGGSNVYPNDNFYINCENFLSAYHIFNVTMKNKFIPLQFSNASFTDGEMQTLDATYRQVQDDSHEIEQYGTILLDGLLSADAYSLALLADPSPPTNPSYVSYFSSISTSYLQYVNVNTRLAEINQTTYQILNYVDQINITLFNMNQTLNAIQLGVQDNNASLQTIITQLNTIEIEITNLDNFNDEMVFLITDSIVATQNAMNADSAMEAKAELKIARDKLQEFQAMVNEEPKQTNSALSYIIGMSLLGIIVIGIFMVSRKKNKIDEDGETVHIFSDKKTNEVIDNE